MVYYGSALTHTSYGSALKHNVYYETHEAVASSSSQGRMEEHVTRSVQNVRSEDLISGRLIGKGPSSIVYETKWEGKSYARKDFLRVPSDIFEREAAALVGLDHPNVLQTYCWTVDEGSCSLVLELMDDDLLDMMQKRLDSQRKKSPGSDSASQKSQLIDLHKFIKDRQNSPRGTVSESPSAAPLLYPFDTPEALRIILQVAEGMKFLHDKRIVHGDLKPKNILVTPRGRVASSSLDENMAFKVADFGLVGTKMKSRALVSRQARRLEMVRWRAPELLNLSRLQEDEHESSSDSDWDSSDQIVGMHVENCTFMDMARADVYNFGLTCSQILHGEDSYSGLGVKDLVNKGTLSGMRPALPPECPDQLSNLIKLCLGEKTARPSFQDILNELNDLQASLTWTGSPMSTIIGLSAGHLGSKLVSEGSKVDQEEGVPIGNKQYLSNYIQDSSVDPTLEGFNRRQRTQRVLSCLGSLVCVTSKVESSSSNMTSMSRLSDMDDEHEEKEDTSILKKRSSWPKGAMNNSIKEIMLKDLRRFSFHEIEKLTDHFSDANAVGLTGTGEFKLFAGRETRTGARVVVKMASRGLDPAKDFDNEITLLSRVHHNNVVGLVGVCAEDEPALVYDDVVNGSVKDWLHGSQSYPPLDWYGRLKIALGAARGLAYLHGRATPIIHRDVKSYNILLDEKLNTKIAHFGLALLATNGADIAVESSPICGTPFYIDPEYISTGYVSTKSDVYGFGMVLLEVVIGKPPVYFDETIRNKVGNTFEYRRGDLAGLRELLDPAIAAATEEDLEKFVTLACSCRAALSSQRPSMREVVQQLESLVAQTHKEPMQPILDAPKRKVKFAVWDKNKSIKELMLKDLRHFSFHEIEILTDNFRHCFQTDMQGLKTFELYAGIETRTGASVVVKRATRGDDWAEDFHNEVTLLSRVHHNNVVGLAGVCFENEPVVVYDDVVNGSLANWLYGSYPPLDWYGRLMIVLGAAKGLAYLHDRATPIIHRDVNSSNIFLDEKLNTKIAYFGLALLATNGADIAVESSPLRGTPFYIDPEYISTGYVSTKSDVYGFGMVLLEVITGKPPGRFHRNKVGNPFTYRSLDLAGLRELLDPAIVGTPEEDLEKFVTLACSCCAALSSQRPSMREVVQQLESLVAQTHKEPMQPILDASRSPSQVLQVSHNKFPRKF